MIYRVGFMMKAIDWGIRVEGVIRWKDLKFKGSNSI
jgi:hypothetical protein